MFQFLIYSNIPTCLSRYGTDCNRERSRLLRHSYRTISRRAWAREKDLLERKEPTRNKWSSREAKQIQNSGSAEGWDVLYVNPPSLFPQLANDLDNVVFDKDKKKRGHH